MTETPSTMLPLGTSAPNFSLPDPSGKLVSLDEFKDVPALLMVFICYDLLSLPLCEAHPEARPVTGADLRTVLKPFVIVMEEKGIKVHIHRRYCIAANTSSSWTVAKRVA